MELLPLACLCLLTRSGTTFADGNEPQINITVREGSEALLPCSISSRGNIETKRFQWKKDDQKEVFLYDNGIYSGSGILAQDPWFKGRVSHFSEELSNGNASITIRHTRVDDSGIYTCEFPNLQPPEISRIKLLVEPQIITVREGSEALLPCSISSRGNIGPKRFQWKRKDDQKEVFLYDNGLYSGNGLSGQDPWFQGRVSHFPDKLSNGNASITIRYTRVDDSGIYTCEFPNLQPPEISHIKLLVGSKPVITTLDQTKDWALLKCEVKGASPKPAVQWQDRAGNILPAKEPPVSERGGSDDIILQTTVTKTDHYRCVATQEGGEPIHTETYVFVPEPQIITVTERSEALLPCSIRSRGNIGPKRFQWKRKDDQKEVFLYDNGIYSGNGQSGQDPWFQGRVSYFPDKLSNGNASITISNTRVDDSGIYTCEFPNLQPPEISRIKLLVGAVSKPHITILDQTNDGVQLQCEVKGASPKPAVQWQDRAGNILPAKEPQVSERGGSYDIILQTTVTKTDHYRCVATQEEINHQTHAETYVFVHGAGWSGGAVFGFVLLGVLLGVAGVGVFLWLKKKDLIPLNSNKGGREEAPETRESLHLNGSNPSV